MNTVLAILLKKTSEHGAAVDGPWINKSQTMVVTEQINYAKWDSANELNTSLSTDGAWIDNSDWEFSPYNGSRDWSFFNGILDGTGYVSLMSIPMIVRGGGEVGRWG